ncbi:MAG: hypothetical protein KAW12_14595 [Candidatus Aminicenantes bacterium]|nr:hypothetical protein [Candidatus Aminicenantes bacterium]
MRAILSSLSNDAADYLDDSYLLDKWPQILKKNGPFSALQVALQQWIKHSDKSVVLFFDEVDALVGDTLISLLRQLRSGYTKCIGL